MDFPDAPIKIEGSDLQPAAELFCNGPEMPKYLGEMGAILERYDAMTVGELPCTDSASRVLDYVSFRNNGLSMVFQFDTVELGKAPNDLFKFRQWSLQELKQITAKWQTFIEGTDGWTTAFIENHDQGRSVSRFASDSAEHHEQSAKMLALLTVCSSGTPFIYMGQEIGMTNVPLDWDLKEYLDVNTINYVQRMRASGASEDDIARIKKDITLHARDNARTPVQWSDQPNAGFTHPDVKPWMRVNDNYVHINAEAQVNNLDSIYGFWQKALRLRQAHKNVFTYGAFRLYDKDNPNVFAFIKQVQESSQQNPPEPAQPGKSHALVLLNFSDQVQKTPAPEEAGNGTLAISNYETKQPTSDLQPYEGRVVLF